MKKRPNNILRINSMILVAAEAEAGAEAAGLGAAEVGKSSII